jgi:hypothetical protein
MTELSSLLRQERASAPAWGRVSAFACALAVVAAVATAANAAELRPDTSTSSASSGLQPDAFPGSAATAKPAAPATPAHASSVGDALTQVPVSPPPTAPKVTQPAPVPATIHVTAPTRPVAITPVNRTPPRTQAPAARPERPVVRLQLPRRVSGFALRLPRAVGGSLALPRLHVRPLPAASVVQGRNLLPAALALLALVATSGCLLGVAARVARDGPGA